MEPNSFGVTRGEQPLVRASRASKVAGAFLVLFWHAKENIPGGVIELHRCVSFLSNGHIFNYRTSFTEELL